MFIRVATGIAEHFDVRFPEWLGAAALIGWGYNLVATPEAWNNPSAWALMLSMMAEDTWGLVCVVAGCLWIAALAINGTFAGTAYSRYSPNVRDFCAFASASIWFLVFISVMTAGSSGRGVYWIPLVLSVWCVFNAWRDVGRRR